MRRMHGMEFLLVMLALLQRVYGDCSLMSSGGSLISKATFQCTDGSIWSITVERGSEDCIYRRFIITPSGEIVMKDSRLICNTAFQFVQDLVSNKNIPMTPDELLPVVDFDNLQPAVY